MIDQREKERTDLIWALRTRVLSTVEMERVKQWGWWLVVEVNSPYYEQEKKQEFNNLLLHQFNLRLATEKELPK